MIDQSKQFRVHFESKSNCFGDPGLTKCIISSDGLKFADLDIKFNQIKRLSLNQKDQDLQLDLESDEFYSLIFDESQQKALDILQAFYQQYDSSQNLIPNELNHLDCFAAILNLLASTENDVNLLELKLISIILRNHSTMQKSRKLTREYEPNELFNFIRYHFSNEQKNCLITNLLDLAFADDQFKSAEAEFINDCRKHIGIRQVTYEAIKQVIIIKNNILLLHKDKIDEVLFAAALYSIVCIDETIGDIEMKAFELVISSKEITENAKVKYTKLGVDGIIKEMKAIEKDVALCLMANLIELSMVDGLLRSSEKKLLKKYRLALSITEDDFQSIFEVLWLKNRTGIFEETER